jgi:hypothetical protein
VLRASSILAGFVGTAVVAIGIAACGASPEPPAETPRPATSRPPPEPGLPPLAAGHAWRVEVMRVMSPGMGAFLQRLEVREQLVDGRFRGFRIMDLRGDPGFWRGTDLKPGDVVTRVNGRSIGHYKEAYKVWQSLATANLLEVEYERAGRPSVWRLVIHDEEKDGGAAAPAADAGAG